MCVVFLPVGTLNEGGLGEGFLKSLEWRELESPGLHSDNQSAGIDKDLLCAFPDVLEEAEIPLISPSFCQLTFQMCRHHWLVRD